MTSKLTKQQELFCQLYTAVGTETYQNGAESYRQAGYSAKGANVSASQLLAKPNIRLRIEELTAETQAKFYERLKITQENTLREIGDMAFSDITDVLDVDAEGNITVVDLKQLPRHVRAMIKKINIVSTIKGSDGDKYTEQRVNLEFHSKERALEMLGKHFGVFKEDGKNETENTGRSREEILEEMKQLGFDVKSLEKDITTGRVH